MDTYSTCPFGYRYLSKKRQNRRLAIDLRAGLPGILTWAARGCVGWQSEGLGETPAVTVATDDCHAEMDLIKQFIEDACETGSEYRENPTVLYNAYVAWCHRQGIKHPILPLRQRSVQR